MSKNAIKNIHFKKSASRLYAIQALFQMEVSKSPLDEITAEFEMHRIGASIGNNTYNKADLSMFKAIINNAVKQQSKIDKLTDQSLDPQQRWRASNIREDLRLQRRPRRMAALGERIQVAYRYLPQLPSTELRR